MAYRTFGGYARSLNRVDRNSEFLLKRIVEDLDPNNFTVEEIVEEGFADIVGRLSDEHVSNKTLKKRTRKVLEKLINGERVELIERGGNSYRVTDLGMAEVES